MQFEYYNSFTLKINMTDLDKYLTMLKSPEASLCYKACEELVL
jgi:hypothetical protein